tara:strand:+ start:6775 stop:8640 length:1866 start_codon:yes stop_codon:yes gene_type:complete
MITVFKNGYELLDAHYVDVNVALSRIKDGASKDIVEKIRKSEDDSEKAMLKISLPSFVFAGECRKEIEKTYKTGKNKGKKYFSKREDESVSEHSGFFVLDFDKIDIEKKMAQLKADPYIYSAWVSPSGNGIKALVRCPKDISKHSLYYNSFIKRYPELDSTSRNICRLCFESYDPNIWVKNSSVWDKTFTKEHKKSNDIQRRENRNNKIISTAVGMVRASVDGDKHNTLLKASKLLGGYVAIGRVDESHARQVLLEEVKAKGIKDEAGAEKTIDDGIEYGKTQPIHETKKIEKSQTFLKREDGSYDFIADSSEMDDYEKSLLEGTLEMGLPSYVDILDTHWMIKKNHLVAFGGIDNIGKSFNAWYIAVISAMHHDWKFLVYSAENKDASVRKKLKEFYIGKPINEMTPKELEISQKFFDEHFKIMTSKKFYTWDDLLMRAEIVFDEGWEYDCVIIDPYNAMDIPTEQSGHIHNVKTLNTLRVFKENYCSVWFCDHAVSSAARDKDNDGFVKVPWKASLDGGQIKANKVDDFIMLHRLTNHPTDWMYTEWHIMKIKDVETGGKPTPKDDPVRMRMNENMCGFKFNDYLDPVRSYWANKRVTDAGVQESMPLSPNEDFDNVPF